MSHEQHYKLLLDTYQKQEVQLVEKHQEVQALKEKYDQVTRKLVNTRQQRDDAKSKFHRKKLDSIENLQKILSTCEESGQSWKEVKEKQARISVSKENVNKVSEFHISLVQEVAKKMKSLDKEIQFENVSSKVEEFKAKAEISKELRVKSLHAVENLNGFNPKVTGYQIPPVEAKSPKKFMKTRGEVEFEVASIKEELKVINEKMKQLEESA